METINITDSDIEYAEKILFNNEHRFDDERRKFIKDFSTLDLQAVPGSGKTTALLAKLLILEKYLPFKNGSGILVLSHTNAAVDEIKERIGKNCPKLFSYPNFIGTIQSFVDDFLAKPFFQIFFRKNINRIDNEIYSERMSKFSKRSLDHKIFTRIEQNNAKRYLRVLKIHDKYRFSYIDNKWKLTNGIGGKALDYKKPKGNTKPKNYQDWSLEEKNKVKKWLSLFKWSILNEGILCYDDAYLLAQWYIKRIPQIIKLLQKRFRYVFVDEMQDMDIHQYDLLEKIFYSDGNSESFYQRIGDKNQAIYSVSVHTDNIWSDREKVLKIKGSHRLSKEIADVVKPFGIDYIDIEGRSEISIKPHIFVYNDNICEVIPKFACKIKSLQDSGKIPENPKHPIKAVAWVKEKDKDEKICLKSYYPSYEENESKPKVDYNSLESYLKYYDKEKNSFDPIRKNILNALLKILRLEGVKTEIERFYTKRTLLKYLKENHTEKYEDLKLNIYQWCLKVIKSKHNEVLEAMKNYIPNFLSLFSQAVNESNGFINNSTSQNGNTTANSATRTKNNIYEYKDSNIKIEVCTVHSVKGQTHTATLYLESFYNKDKDYSYESQRLEKQFQGINIDDTNKKRRIQSAKMAYVGFSRPTHLLAFAVNKERFDKHLKDNIDRTKWEIIEI